MGNMSLKKAAIINAASKYTTILLNLLFSVILSRILSPNDYGIVAIITVFTTFFITLADMGLGTAVIQNKDLCEDDINYIYTFTVYAAIFLSLVFAFGSYPISVFYNDNVYISLGIILSFSLLFNSLNIVPNAILLRNKRFLLVAFRTVIVYVLTGTLTIIMALHGFKYYALAIQSVLIAIFTFSWNFCSTKLNFKVKVSKNSMSKVASFSAYQFGFNIINYFARNLDNLLTGKVMGSADLGYYNKAYSLMLYPVNNLAGIITPILHPIFSDYQKEKQIIYNKYIKVVKILALMGIFVSTFCFLGAREIIGIVYGQQWTKSIVCFQYLSISVCFQMITSSTGSVFQSLGNTKLLFIGGTINAIITIIAIIAGIIIGNIESLALCVGISYILHFIISFYFLLVKGFELSIKKFYFDLRKEIWISAILLFAVALFPFKNIISLYWSFSVKFILLGLVYLVCLLLTNEYKIFLNFIHKDNYNIANKK